jgi:hypothetical protein
MHGEFVQGGVRRIISGGQTGVDRGALDAAIELGLEHGGWCPRGRMAEDGPIPPQYGLTETAAAQYWVRTRRNVLDSDATLILCWGAPSGGTELTLRMAAKHGKPYLLVDLSTSPDPAVAREWVGRNRIAVLNVAGPRESAAPGIANSANQFLRRVLG